MVVDCDMTNSQPTSRFLLCLRRSPVMSTHPCGQPFDFVWIISPGLARSQGGPARRLQGGD